MTTYFVSTTGRDSASGTQETPLATIGRALALARSGDTVFVRGGRYVEQVKMETPGVTLSAWADGSTGSPTAKLEPVTVDGEYRLPDIPGVAGGTNKDGTWFDFNYGGLVELKASGTILRGIVTRQSKGRGIEIGGASDVLRTSNNIVEDCQTIDHRHCGLGGKYFNNLTIRRHRNSGTGNFAPFRRATAAGVPNNHPASCSFQVGTNLVIEDLESTNSWGEAIMFNNCIHVSAKGLKAWDCMTGGVYVNACGWLTIDGWTTFYNDVGRLPAGGEIQAGVFINRENHKSDWGALENVCHDILIANGVSVNNDRGISLLGALGLFPFTNIEFRNNTIVRPSLGRAGVSSALFVAGQGKFAGVVFDHNLVHLSDPVTQKPATAPMVAGVKWRANAWSHMPDIGQRNTADIYGNLQLTNPLAQIVGGNVDIENYRLKAGSIAAGFGALQPLVSEPPVTVSYPGGALRRGLRAGVR